MYLGVDGGGTKTAFCLIDRNGAIRARAETGTSAFLSIGVDAVEGVLREGVGAVCAAAGIAPDGIDHAFFGMPGYGEIGRIVPVLDAIPERILGHRRYACDNDMVAGWAGSLGAADGINVIAGTGSMTYGERAGRGFRCGGWGEVFGDEGSGYWIGSRGLAAFSRMSDGRMEPTALHRALRDHLGLAADLDLVDVVLNRWKADRGRIASLAKVVAACAGDGDPAARRIMGDAAGELALIVEATRRALGFPEGGRVPVSYSGGVLQPNSLVVAEFERRLGDLSPDYDLRRPLHTPVVGAALYAAKLAGVDIAVGRETR